MWKNVFKICIETILIEHVVNLFIHTVLDQLNVSTIKQVVLSFNIPGNLKVDFRPSGSENSSF